MTPPKDLAKLPVEKLVSLMTAVLTEDFLPSLKADLQEQIDDWSAAHYNRIVQLSRDVGNNERWIRAHEELHDRLNLNVLPHAGPRSDPKFYGPKLPIARPEIQDVLEAAKAFKTKYRRTIVGGGALPNENVWQERLKLVQAVNTAERAGLL